MASIKPIKENAMVTGEGSGLWLDTRPTDRKARTSQEKLKKKLAYKDLVNLVRQVVLKGDI